TRPRRAHRRGAGGGGLVRHRPLDDHPRGPGLGRDPPRKPAARPAGHRTTRPAGTVDGDLRRTAVAGLGRPRRAGTFPAGIRALATVAPEAVLNAAPNAAYEPSPILRAARKADCGISTLPYWRIRFLPSFCFSNSLRLR